jgi:DinB superfamily
MASPTRLDLLLRQLDTSHEALVARLAGLTDEEYFWEPVPGCITITERDGRWQPVLPPPSPPPASPPPNPLPSSPPPSPPWFTTLARRLGHLTVECVLMRWEYTFGDHKLTLEDIDYGGTAADALALLDEAYTKWRTGLGGLRDADLDVVGLSTMPRGLDPDLPFGDVLWWNNREYIHHGAEIAMLRDLWAHSSGGTAFS